MCPKRAIKFCRVAAHRMLLVSVIRLLLVQQGGWCLVLVLGLSKMHRSLKLNHKTSLSISLSSQPKASVIHLTNQCNSSSCNADSLLSLPGVCLLLLLLSSSSSSTSSSSSSSSSHQINRGGQRDTLVKLIRNSCYK